MSESVRLLEYVRQPQKGLTVDTDAGVIRGVRVLGLASANGRSYLREAVEAAIPLYAGRAVNVDHPGKQNEATAVSRRLGWLENVRQEADGGLRADLHYLKSHPMSAALVEAATRRPQLMGLSHNARGRTKRGKDGKEVVEAIEAVNSVDLVADPASVSGLHEGKRKAMTNSELIECLKQSEPWLSNALREVAEAGLMDPAAEAAPAPSANGDDHKGMAAKGMVDAITKILNDAIESGDFSQMDEVDKYVKMIKKHLGMNGKKNGGAAAEEAPVEEMPAAEGRRQAKANLREQALLALGRKGIQLTPLIERAVAGCATEAEVKELVESLIPQRSQGQQPRSATPSPRQSAAGKGAGTHLREDQAPDDRKGAIAWLKG